jgi:hypothetical protein
VDRRTIQLLTAIARRIDREGLTPRAAAVHGVGGDLPRRR